MSAISLYGYINWLSITITSPYKNKDGITEKLDRMFYICLPVSYKRDTHQSKYDIKCPTCQCMQD